MSGGTTSNFVRVDEDSDEGDPASPDQSVRQGSLKCIRIDACVSESANSFGNLYHLNLNLVPLGVYVKTI